MKSIDKYITMNHNLSLHNKSRDYIALSSLSHESNSGLLFQLAQHYIEPNEKLEGIALGGGESLVFYVRSLLRNELFVRKIWSTKMLSVNWKETKDIIMTPPVKKGYLQVKYLRGLPKEVKPYFPEIYNIRKEFNSDGSLKQVVCDESYISGIPVSKFILHYKPKPQIVAHLYTEIFRCLKEVIHKHKKNQVSVPTLESSYFKKIEDRINTTKNALPKTIEFLTNTNYLYINSEKYINTPLLINKFRNHQYVNILEPKYHGLVTGDTNTQNIIISNVAPILKAIEGDKGSFSFKDIGIKFIDPRSLGFNSEGEDTIDDFMYDNKPFHNSLGNYDMIYGKHFDLKISTRSSVPSVIIAENNNPYRSSYIGLEGYFKEIMDNGWKVNTKEFLKNDPYWLIRFVFLMGTHFAAMPPFQVEKDKSGSVKDEKEIQKKVVAIYCEGVKWLNLAYRMLCEEINEFNGFSMPIINKNLR